MVFTDPASQKRVLRLRTDQPIDTSPEKIGTEIDSAVAALFAKIPDTIAQVMAEFTPADPSIKARRRFSRSSSCCICAMRSN